MENYDISKWIVYDDENIVIFNKPCGVLVQQNGTDKPSLDKLACEYFKKDVWPAHRLDEDTSGLVIFGKNNKSLTYLNLIFSDHKLIEKHYLTLANGVINEGGEINAPLRKSFERKKMVVAPIKSGAKEAITKYSVVKNFENSTLLDITLITGRTHQIRAHFSYFRHHIIGDSKYGDYKANNIYEKEFGLKHQFLHSWKITFKNLDKPLDYLSERSFEAGLPEHFQAIIEKLQ